MTEIRWQNLWNQSQANPYERVVFSLLLLNGLQLSQIANLADAQINLSDGWITTHDGRIYPLVSHSREALVALNNAEPVLSEEKLTAATKPYEPFEHEAHRRLAGAIWITDETLQLTLETTGSREIPLLPLRFTFPFSIAERLQPDAADEIAVRAQYVLQNAADWLVEQTLNEQVSLVRRIFGLLRQGSLIFLLTSTGVNGLNLIHNVLMGRLLSLADYSQLTLIITLQLLISLLPAAIQTVVARFSARYHAQKTTTLLQALHQQTGRFAWIAGAVVGGSVLMKSRHLYSGLKNTIPSNA